MKFDYITEIGIDEMERLYIKPHKEHFSLVWRIATEVHWDDKGLFLYSLKPKEWSYLTWYKHIVGVAETGVNCKLLLTPETKWINIPEELKNQIVG